MPVGSCDSVASMSTDERIAKKAGFFGYSNCPRHRQGRLQFEMDQQLDFCMNVLLSEDFGGP